MRYFIICNFSIVCVSLLAYVPPPRSLCCWAGGLSIWFGGFTRIYLLYSLWMRSIFALFMIDSILACGIFLFAKMDFIL